MILLQFIYVASQTDVPRETHAPTQYIHFYRVLASVFVQRNNSNSYCRNSVLLTTVLYCRKYSTTTINSP